ncbi:YaiI/YqxD family protein [Rhodopirellula halodulae]|uniref:YaiI/YqxD family protein n=1 Tax=Rhodopirellula halodulae TaxID=2894198 RepID=UPI001E56EB8C|nr:YaiI/YqxD family protein [Rhodopirellula sp. JC737]MCC9655350.1 YaiI/YqxD family protein [Rhodopirellula sp. JC737]
MKIWIDADAAPRDVKEVVFRAANRLQIETILVANSMVTTPANATTVRCVVVRDGADQADRYIVRHGEPGELAVTADLPLAGMLVDKGLAVVDPRGEEYSSANIASRLSMRNFMDELRGAGMETGGSAPYGPKDKKAFASTFDRLLTRAIRRAGSSS